MTQEDKELLLKDICARLPYGVKVTNGIHIITLTPCSDTSIIIKNEHILPYLRPLSSMTEEEKEEYWTIICPQYDENGKIINKDADLFDWLNKKMLDYRGLIEKGLAIEAPKGMYNINEK